MSHNNNGFPQGHSKRKSQFLGSSTIPSGALLDVFVPNQSNIKVTFSDFLVAIGTTGTLTQNGAVGSTAVLNGTSPNFVIRSLENGPAVKASVSPSNGITVEHNFTVGLAGNPMMLNPTALSPTIPSLIAGTGVSIVAGSNSYTLNATGAVTPTGTVVINLESDFLVQDATTITLQAETIYIIASDITTAKRFIVQNGAVFTALNVDGASVTFTGTGAMFTGVDTAFSLHDITIDCPSATALNWTNTAPTSRFMIDTVQITSCTKIATFTNTFSVIVNNCLFAAAIQGFEFFGTVNQNWSFSQSIILGTTPSFIGVNLGSAQSTIIDFEGVLWQAPIGGVGISGLINSGNIPVSRLGRVQNCEFFPPITALQNITADDIRWFFQLSPPVKNTAPMSLVTLRGNAVETVISVINTPVLVAGTWVVNKESLFSGTTGGRSTYNAETDFSGLIDVSAGLISASGGAINVTLYIALNGTVITNSGVQVAISGSAAQTVSIPWEETISENDFIEVYVENNSGTVNIIAENATNRIA